MPALSPTMTQGNIGTWRAKEGDPIAPGDVLCEIETDKATMDLEAQDDGFLARILIPEGTKDVKVGRPLAIIANLKDDIPRFANYAVDNVQTSINESSSSITPDTPLDEIRSEEASNEKPIFTTDAGNLKVKNIDSADLKRRIIASPLAKSMARQANVSLDQIKGSGPGGRIVSRDIFSENLDSTIGYVDVPVSSMRQTIAKRLTEAKQTIPHYNVSMEINVERLLSLRERLNQELANDGLKLSVNDFIVKAAGHALKAFPEMNVSWRGSTIRKYSRVGVSVAVSLPGGDGLLTPIVQEPQMRSLKEINICIKDLADRARAGKLKVAEFEGGTFTVSNLGKYGVSSFTAIINPPQAAILAVGGIFPRLVPPVSEDSQEISVESFMCVSLSCDHRVIDGALAAMWLHHFKGLLEDPAQMLL